MPRFLRQFGLRTLLLFCTFAAICFGLWRWHMTWVDQQHVIAKQIADRNGNVRWGTWGPSWAHDAFTSYYFQQIIAVDLSHKNLRDQDLQLLREIPTLEELYVPGNHKITDEGMKVLEHLPRIRKLAIWNTKLGNETLKSVAKLRDLEVLDLSLTKMTPAGINLLNGSPKLKRLLHDWVFDDAGIEGIASLPSVEMHTIRANDLSDASFERIQQHIHVENLIVRRPTGDQWASYLLNHPTICALQVYQGKMSDSQLRKLLLSNRLDSLHLEDVPVGDAALFPRLDEMQMTRFTVFGTKISAQAILDNLGPSSQFVSVAVDPFQPVVKVSLTGASYGPDCYWIGSFDPADLQHLDNCGEIKQLAITGLRLPNPRLDFGDDPEARRKYDLCCKVDDDDMKMIAQMRGLESLRITGTDRLSVEGLRPIDQLTSLTTLELRSTKLTDEHLKTIGKLKTLEQLDLTGNRITSAGIRKLAGLTKLTHLNLTDCHEVDDEAMAWLIPLKNLKYLDVSGTKIGAISPELEKANPNLYMINYQANNNMIWQRPTQTARVINGAIPIN